MPSGVYVTSLLRKQGAGLTFMAIFELALQTTLLHEGGYSNRPDDPVTNYGITQQNFDLWRRERGMQTQDVKDILPEEVREIYLDWFWTPSHAQEINDQSLGAKFFDLSVNMGLHTACELLQFACADAGHPTLIDGIPGHNTIASVNACDPQNLLIALRQRARDYYNGLVNRKPEKRVFLNGWLNRVDS